MMEWPIGNRLSSLLFGAILGILLLTISAGAKPPKELKTFTNPLGMEFVYIPAGDFIMGSPSDEYGRGDNEAQHRVTLTRGFYMQTMEVTQGQWKAVMGGNPSYFQECGDDCPVESVSWEDAQKFIRRLNALEGTDNYRLPFEAEWEYACRAGSTTPYWFGEEPPRDSPGYHGRYSTSEAAKGRYKKGMLPAVAFGPNAWGMLNMHTDVWEWCQDWYGEYPAGPVIDPIGRTTGVLRVARGGRWFFHNPLCRSANRGMLPPDYRDRNLGFRLARTPSEKISKQASTPRSSAGRGP